jgi:hypothetical protein
MIVSLQRSVFPLIALMLLVANKANAGQDAAQISPDLDNRPGVARQTQSSVPSSPIIPPWAYTPCPVYKFQPIYYGVVRKRYWLGHVQMARGIVIP